MYLSKSVTVSMLLTPSLPNRCSGSGAAYHLQLASGFRVEVHHTYAALVKNARTAFAL